MCSERHGLRQCHILASSAIKSSKPSVRLKCVKGYSGLRRSIKERARKEHVASAPGERKERTKEYIPRRFAVSVGEEDSTTELWRAMERTDIGLGSIPLPHLTRLLITRISIQRFIFSESNKWNDHNMKRNSNEERGMCGIRANVVDIEKRKVIYETVSNDTTLGRCTRSIANICPNSKIKAIYLISSNIALITEQIL